MKHRSFMPIKDEDRNAWLQNFADKIAVYANRYSITTSEVQKIKLCATNYQYWLHYHYALQAYAKSVTLFRKSLNQELGVPLTMPVLPNLGTPPAMVPSGTLKFIMSVAQRIKMHLDFTQADGYDLGLITPKASRQSDVKQLKPDLELKLVEGGQVQVVWHKPDGIDALEIHVDRSDGKGFVLCDIDTKPHYTDHTPLPLQPTWWRYMAIYRVDDKITGQWSNPCKIMVGKE
jgi:hypothetical protein